MSKSFQLRRRGLLAGVMALVGGHIASATASETEKAERGQPKRSVLTIDVAVLGHTNYDNEGGAANRHPDYRDQHPDQDRFRSGFRQSDLRGSMQYHEGLIYPGGTIPAPKEKGEVNWNFEREPIGTFFDRGWVVINNKSDGPYEARPDPHLLSHTDYYLGGVVTAENLTPTDMIAVIGLQHDSQQEDPRFLRAVVGGTGRFARVRGQMVQRPWGNNSSILQGLFIPKGIKPPSPNFRIDFELWL